MGHAALREGDDAFGRLLLDHLEGRTGEPLLERDDGSVGPALGADYFFSAYEGWPPEEQLIFDSARGRVLDVGCGAGRHSLEAQERGLDVVAIDISPGAVEASRRCGVRDARLLALAEIGPALGVFDTVLMMCGNFGLVGDAGECRRILLTLHDLTTPGGRIILDSVDPRIGNDAADLAYQRRNAERGCMPGQVMIRIRYGERSTPWFNLLNISPPELEQLARPAGWRTSQVLHGEPPDWYAVLEKAPAARAGT